MKLENGDGVRCQGGKFAAVCRRVCVVVIVCLAVASRGHSKLTPRYFEDPSETGSFDSVTVDQETGDVYVASTSGAVYQLTDELQLVDVYRSATSTTHNNTATRLLEFIPPTSTDDVEKKFKRRRKLLLYCETDLCVVLDSSGRRVRPVSRFNGVVNVVSVDDSLSSSSNVLLFVPRRQPSLVNSSAAVVVVYSAVVAPQPVDADTLAALVLEQQTTLDDSSSSSSSSLTLRWRYLAETDGGGRSGIRLHSAAAERRRMTRGAGLRYVHAFDDGRFAYFVVVQPTLDGDVETRLARVCIDDTAFQSYSELAVLCRRRPTFQTYFRAAVAAVVAPMGATLAQRLGEHVGDDPRALYIVMGDAQDGYGICVYPLADVRHEFTQAQRDCYRGSGRILASVDADEPRCTEDVSYLLVFILFLRSVSGLKNRVFLKAQPSGFWVLLGFLGQAGKNR